MGIKRITVKQHLRKVPGKNKRTKVEKHIREIKTSNSKRSKRPQLSPSERNVGRTIIRKNGKQVASAQNLEVITRYNRDNSPVKYAKQRGNYLLVGFEDGAIVTTRFADPSVLKEWIRRKRVRGIFP